MNIRSHFLLALGLLACVVVTPLAAAVTKVNILATFTASQGSSPKYMAGSSPNGLLLSQDGNFYGTAYSGGTAGQGAVFKLTPNGLLSALVSFDGAAGGALPKGGLIEASDGYLYGTTSSGGAANQGTVFQVTRGGTLTTMASFKGDNGALPDAGVIEGSDGNFYGTTAAGGTYQKGVFFRMSPAGGITVLCAFNGNNGASPRGVIQGRDGNFYGTTTYGGDSWDGDPAHLASSYGTVFRITPDGTLKVLVSFEGGNGSYPFTGLVEGADGHFYGTTYGVVTGTVFELTPEGDLVTLAKLGGAVGAGAGPLGTPILDADGNIYGTTFFGGKYDKGALYRITQAGELTTLVSFGGAIGVKPTGNLVLDAEGNLEGTTTTGGPAARGGLVFQTILKQAQTIRFPKVTGAKVGQTATLEATASSGLPVTYRVVSGRATLSGNQVTFTGLGVVKIAVSQEGNASFAAAPEVTIAFSVAKGPQTIAPLQMVPDQLYPGRFSIVIPTSSSGLPVRVTVKSGPAVMITSTIVATDGVGRVYLAADQAGNATYAAAPTVTTTFVVRRAA